MLTPPGEESTVNNFAAHILSMPRYDELVRVIRQHKDILLFTLEMLCTRRRMPE